MKYNIVEIIEKKINKGKLTEEEIEYFVDGYTKGDIKDYQAASLVLDKHSTGGVGDKVTIALIPILASLRIYST